MTEVRVAYLNYREGGLNNGVFEFAPLAAAFQPLRGNAPDVIALCEGKRWAHHGGAGIHGACAALDDLLDVPYQGEPGWHWRGDYGPAIVWNPITMRMDRWTGADHESNAAHDRNIARFRLRREPGKRLNVLVRHYAYDSGLERIMEAERDTSYARDDVPTLLVGDLNSTASGPHVPQRDWRQVPPWKLRHKSRRNWRGRSVNDTRSLDILIGRHRRHFWATLPLHLSGRENRAIHRVHGAGFSALAELAYASGIAAEEAFRGTDNSRDGHASMMIDWMLANRPLAERFVPDSYRVHLPAGKYPDTWWSDHRLQTATFRL